jgi:hypothetical protein
VRKCNYFSLVIAVFISLEVKIVLFYAENTGFTFVVGGCFAQGEESLSLSEYFGM